MLTCRPRHCNRPEEESRPRPGLQTRLDLSRGDLPRLSESGEGTCRGDDLVLIYACHSFQVCLKRREFSSQVVFPSGSFDSSINEARTLAYRLPLSLLTSDRACSGNVSFQLMTDQEDKRFRRSHIPLATSLMLPRII